MRDNNSNLFKKIFTKEENDAPVRQLELIKSIIETNRELKLANQNFESAEKELIDYYAYQIKANKAKLDYLIREVKQKGTSLNIVQALEIGLYNDEASGL
ncbi:MAG: YaaL family protein [Oscillospiraceae bacterium]|nr:YaaL family protein [Oscillospiraceae bacterium]